MHQSPTAQRIIPLQESDAFSRLLLQEDPPTPRWYQKFLPLESFASACLTLFSSTLCSGLLLMPFTLNLPGWGAGLAATVLGFLVNLYTGLLLLNVADETSRFTLDLMFAESFCRDSDHWYHFVALKLTQFAVMLSNYGSVVFHFMIVWNRQMVIATDSAIALYNLSLSDRAWILYLIGTMWAVVVFLLSHFEMLTTLRYFSLMSVVCTCFVALLLPLHQAVNERGFALKEQWSTERQVLAILISLFTFTCQTNIGGIYKVPLPQEMKNRQRHGWRMLTLTLSAVLTFALAFGFLGSWSIASDSTNYPIIKDFFTRNYLLAVSSRQGSLSFSVSMMLNTPLLVFPITDVVFRAVWRKNQCEASRLHRAAVTAGKQHSVTVFSAAFLAAMFSFYIEWCMMILSVAASLYVCVLLPCALYIKKVPSGQGTVRKAVCWILSALTLLLYVLGPLYISFWITPNETCYIVDKDQGKCQ